MNIDDYIHKLTLAQKGVNPEISKINNLDIAKKLVKEHGHIPNGKWLTQNGYDSFRQYVYTHQEMFKDFPRQAGERPKGKEVLEKHRETARRLQEEYGKIPSAVWLQKNSYATFYNYVKQHPEYFREFQFDVRSERTEEEKELVHEKRMLEQAEKLVGRYGFLPNNYWLSRHGYSSIMYLIKRKPELFAHFVVQEPEETNYDSKKHHFNLSVANKLVKEFGRIPSFGWLQKNGYGHFAQYVRDNPNLFSNYKIEWINPENGNPEMIDHTPL